MPNALVWNLGNIVGAPIDIAIVTILLYAHVELYTSLLVMLIFSVIL